jgi:phosphoglycerate dehydrogenase-like enzyme
MKVSLLFNAAVRSVYITDEALARLLSFADVGWIECDGPTSFAPLPDPSTEMIDWASQILVGTDAVVLCHGAPRFSAALIDRTTTRFIGELEGDRFSPRVDVDAAEKADIAVVDTTHGSAPAVAEWTLALMLVSLRNASEHFRRFMDRSDVTLTAEVRETDRGYTDGELRGKAVGLIGLGHIAQELIHLLHPFDVSVKAFDPFVDAGRATALDVDLCPLHTLLSLSDVVVVLAPETPRTRHLLSPTELDRIRPGGVLVNSSRGSVVDSDALLHRLNRGDLWVGLDVWDPDPCPPGSPLRSAPNVFYSPHIAGVTLASRRRTFELMVDELARFQIGVPPRAQLTRQARNGRA